MTDIPKTMKAMVLHGHGGLDQLRWHEDWPCPQPAPGEVLIRVGACGINNTDINTRTAWYSDTVKEGISVEGGAKGFSDIKQDKASWSSRAIAFPRIQGADTAGVIVAVGDGVDRSRVGERVIVDGWLLPHGTWFDAARVDYYGSECDGGFAEYSTIRAANAIRIDSSLTDAELATFPCALMTAENLVARTGLQPGETAVVAGASGGVGGFAIQLARLRGARVIAIAGKAKHDAVTALGADAVIDRDHTDLEAAIREAAGGAPQVALDVVGGTMTAALLKALAHGGRYSSCGAIAGPMMEFDLRWLIYKDLQMTGATIVPPGTWDRLARLIENGDVKPALGKVFPLAELHAAQEAFIAKTYAGNIVVDCSPDGIQ
ncbi:MAG: zinc-binding dehydrogenase [Candidatus Puniceispirillales bacterium]